MSDIDVLKKLSEIEEELRNLKYSLKSKERFLNAAGKWGDLDTDQLKKNIYKARGITTRNRAVFE